MLFLSPGLIFSQSVENISQGHALMNTKKGLGTIDDQKSQNWNAKIGFVAGACIPVGHFSDQDSASLNIGGFISFPISTHHDELVFELSCLFSNMGSDIKNVVKSYGFNVTKSMVMTNAYTRCGIIPNFFVDSGCGVYFPTVSASAVLQTNAIKKACFGLCLGPTFQFTNSLSFNMYVSTKFHTYKGEDNWVQFFRMDVQIAFTM